jgi:hypothetical protein
MKFISLLFVAVALSGLSCERHAFEGPAGTKQLHEHPASHGDEVEPSSSDTTRETR